MAPEPSTIWERVVGPDGTKGWLHRVVQGEDICPKRLGWLERHFWLAGFDAGSWERLRRWLTGRRVAA